MGVLITSRSFVALDDHEAAEAVKADGKGKNI